MSAKNVVLRANILIKENNMSKFSDSVMGQMRKGANGGEIQSPHSAKNNSKSNAIKKLKVKHDTSTTKFLQKPKDHEKGVPWVHHIRTDK